MNIKDFFVKRQLAPDNPLLDKRFEQSRQIHNSIIRQQQRDEQDTCVLLGPEHCHKGSLLFQYAYNLIDQNMDRDPDFQVVLICSRNVNTPLIQSVEDEQRHTQILSMIKMKYLESTTLFTQYLSNLHLLPLEHLPRSIFVHNFSSLFSNTNTMDDNVSATDLNESTNESNMRDKSMDASHMKLLGLLQNTVEFLKIKFNVENVFTPSFLITDQLTALPFFDRWCETVIKVYEYVDNQVAHSNTFCIQYTKIHGQVDPRRTKLTYQIVSGSILVTKFDFAKLPSDDDNE
jgi:hypothetical protein